mmetsp:Transcript_31677/g.62211  ORF Transcript_31677/g.62211 Transcript_31677/m.62211 type:complete len:178 (-) Transcript_31677:116-649(-)|eukprot:CAMPEP_0172675296 /NCGR_PEP_ID=MMETSP1074-20121228/13191_1 /TAXON_ID=2916 /ORGANISM="Ceratium fusus, Strain PA161109" /LENGTH=177 /DNA_ID=CAMNT_0013492749 /DNA_START=55 /DNA_END=588 /DNA_ORIENTATION=+
MAVRQVLASVLLAVAAAKMKCPGSSAWIHSGMKITSFTSATCDVVKEEAILRVANQYRGWHDPHNNGTYAVAKPSLGGDISFTRVTGDGKYTDKMIISLTDEDGRMCRIEGCSESQVTSLMDFGTNYCNLKMLWCGKADGCKVVSHDFTTTNEKTESMKQASVDMSKCQKVATELLV